MVSKKQLEQHGSLFDDDNVMMVDVTPPEDEPVGMTVEEAYRHLAGMPPAPVEVPEEIL